MWAVPVADPPIFAARNQCAQHTISRRRRQGIKYEARVHEYMRSRFGDCYIASQWFVYRTNEPQARHRWCQTDGLLLDTKRGRITIIEVKHQHTPQAYRQIFDVYLPVVRAVFPPAHWSYHACEIVKWYDPSTHFPVVPILTYRIDHLREAMKEFGVHIWRGT